MSSKRKYWGCEMDSKLYWEVTEELKENRARLIRHLNGVRTVDDVVAKRGIL